MKGKPLSLQQFRLKSWPAAAVAILIVQIAFSLALTRPSFRIASTAITSFFVLLLAAGLAVQNAVQSRSSIRLFWSFLASGCGLWALNPALWAYHLMGWARNYPAFWLSSSSLFLHVVLLLAAVVSRPHLQQPSQKPYRATLNFLLLLFFLVFIYAFFLVPYPSTHWDSPAILHFGAWYFVENLFLLAVIAAMIFRAQQPWKSIYGHLLGASSLYAFTALVLNVVVVARNGLFGGLDAVLYVGVACWFVWIAVLGRNLAAQLGKTVRLDASNSKSTFPLAMLAVTAIPAIGVWELLRTDELYATHAIRLLIVLITFLLLAVFAFAREYLTGQILIADAGSAADRLRLAMESSKSVAWDWDVKSGRDSWFGDLETMFGIPSDSYSGSVEDFRRRIHPSDRGRIWKAVNDARQTHGQYAEEFRVIRENGTERWIAARGKFSYATNGDAERMLGMATDISESKRAEEALRRSEAMKVSILSSLENHIAVLDKQGIIIEVNEVWSRLAQENGMTAEPVGVGSDYLAALSRSAAAHPEALSVLACIRPVMRGAVRRCRYDYKCDWLAPPRWFAMTATPLHMGEDGVVVVYKDISDVRHKDAALAEAQRLANVGSWQWDPATDTVTWSEELYRIAGMDPGLPAVSFRDHAKLYTAESWQRLRKCVEEALRTGEPYELDLEMLRADGSSRWLVARGETQRDAAGRIVRLHGTAHEISERKRAEQALRESEERFRLVSNTAPVMIWMAGPDKLFTFFNKTWLNFTGRDIETELGNGWTAGVHPEDLQRFSDSYMQAFDRRDEFKIECRIRRHDGQYRWVLDAGVPRFNQDGSFAGYIGSCVDVTERKTAEETLSTLGRRLIAAHEEERTWIARELHDDISQRLALLSIGLEGLQRTPVPDALEFSEQIKQVRQQTSDIANDIETISHRLHSSKVEYLGLVVAARAFCAEFSRQQKVVIDFLHDAVPRDLPSEVEMCLFRVLQEALRNAAKHSGMGQIEVELRAGANDLHLTVRDFGVGFDPGTALHQNGLGLVSMRERLLLVNGELTIDSSPSGGTAIHASVPLWH